MPQVLKPNTTEWLDTAAEAIHDGKIVALAYERLFGLAVNALDEDAVTRAAAVKGREDGAATKRPIAVILPRIDAVSLVSDDFSTSAKQLAKRHWPGALTLIVRAKPGLPAPLVSDAGLIGIRVAGKSPAATLAVRTGLPLTATSANRANAPDALSHREVLALDEIDYVVEGEVPGPPGSTIVDASGPFLKILRQGIVRIEGDI